MHHLAVTMAMDGQPLERIQQLLAVSVGTSDLSQKTIVQDAVERIITALRYDELQLADFSSPMSFSLCLFFTLASTAFSVSLSLYQSVS